MLNAKLVVVGGDAQQAEVQLRLPLVIGRGRDVGLTVSHALVSRRHCEIIERNGRLVVRDLGSLNGTFVNNQRIEDEQTLEPEQLLTLGNITFRAVYQIDDQVPDRELQAALETEPDSRGLTESESVSADTKRSHESGVSEDANLIEQGETIPVDELQSSPEAETVPTGDWSEDASDLESDVAVHAQSVPSDGANGRPNDGPIVGVSQLDSNVDGLAELGRLNEEVQNSGSQSESADATPSAGQMASDQEVIYQSVVPSSQTDSNSRIEFSSGDQGGDGPDSEFGSFIRHRPR